MSRSRRALFGLLLFAVLLAVAELASLAGFLWLDGGFSYAGLQADRRRVAAGAEALAPGQEREVPRDATAEVLHPFLGFVFNPELDDDPERRARNDLHISELGFFLPPTPEPAPPAEALRVGIFGGSAALLFSFAGRDRLADLLARDLGRPVVVESFALGGYKQPQQLMALTWLLTLGRRLDVVINLDGFNEIALPAAENLPGGMNPFFPRNWRRLVTGRPAPGELGRIGEIAYLRRRRAGAAEAFARRPLSWSVTANLLWRARDRALARRIADLELDLPAAAATYPVPGPFPAYGGPAEMYRDLGEIWGRSSLLMHELCSARGIGYYHFLQPNQYVPGSKPMRPRERRQAVRADHPYRRAVEVGYPVLQQEGERLRRQGVAFHDLTDVFAGVSEAIYFDDCCHFNRRGSEIIAETVAEVIRGDSRASASPLQPANGGGGPADGAEAPGAE